MLREFGNVKANSPFASTAGVKSAIPRERCSDLPTHRHL